MGQEAVPTFYLYGEPHRSAADDFLHIESLDDRSRPAGWEIQPHAHRDLNHMILIAAGGGTMQTEAAVAGFEAPCLLLMPAGVVHGFRWTAESTGWVMTLGNSQRDDLLRRDQTLAALFAGPGVAVLDAEAARTVSDQAARLVRELGWAAPGHRAAVEAALLSVMVEALRSLNAGAAVGSLAPGRQAGLVARFRALVEERYRLREPIGSYAARLGVSATTLRVACAQIAGMPPGEILNVRSLLEARRALTYTDWTVAEIAYALGFADPAYFTRLFTREVGYAPRHFRQERSAGRFA